MASNRIVSRVVSFAAVVALTGCGAIPTRSGTPVESATSAARTPTETLATAPQSPSPTPQTATEGPASTSPNTFTGTPSPTGTTTTASAGSAGPTPSLSSVTPATPTGQPTTTESDQAGLDVRPTGLFDLTQADTADTSQDPCRYFDTILYRLKNLPGLEPIDPRTAAGVWRTEGSARVGSCDIRGIDTDGVAFSMLLRAFVYNDDTSAEKDAADTAAANDVTATGYNLTRTVQEGITFWANDPVDAARQTSKVARVGSNPNLNHVLATKNNVFVSVLAYSAEGETTSAPKYQQLHDVIVTGLTAADG